MNRFGAWPRHAAILIVALALALMPAGGRAADAVTAEDAGAFISKLGSKAITELGDESVSYDTRVQTFRQMVQEYFAMEAISRFVLGRYWRVATSEEQGQFREAFLGVITQRFLPLFEGFEQDDFKVESAKPAPNNPDRLFLVSSRIAQPDGTGTVKAGWRVQNRDEGLQIVDVLAEGVSMAITLRSEYNSVIQRNGGQVAALIAMLEENLAKGAYKPDTVQDALK